MVIHFKDGSQYSILDREEMVMNATESFWRASEKNNYGDSVFLFNRLIDVDNVISVEIDGHWLESVVADDGYENIRHEESFIFQPVLSR